MRTTTGALAATVAVLLMTTAATVGLFAGSLAAPDLNETTPVRAGAPVPAAPARPAPVWGSTAPLVAPPAVPEQHLAAVAAPTQPPAPSQAPRPATATGVPTPVPPTPTSAAEPGAPAAAGVPADARRYLGYMIPKMQTAGEALSALGEQTRLLGANPRLLLDPDWRRRTAVAVALMKVTGEELQAYNDAPPVAVVLQATISSIGQDLVYVGDEYAQAIDKVDATRMANAAERTRVITGKTAQAVAHLRTLGQTY